MSEAWLDTVDRYLHQLGESLDQVNFCGDLFIEQTANGDFQSLGDTTDKLLSATQSLEALLQTRGEILQAATPAGGTRPRSLRTALTQAGDNQRLELAETLAKRVEQARRQSVTLFVTQFQLFETSEMILSKMLNRGPDPGTYGPAPKRRGGGLLDDAA